MLHWLGLFHPLLIHFPIALLLTAGAIEGWGVWRQRDSLAPVVRLNLSLGALGAVLAAVTGWSRAGTMGFEPDLKSSLFLHRWAGVTTAILSLFLVGLWHWSEGMPGRRRWARMMLFLLVILVVVTGHWGSVLVYGADYFAF
jgi:uncharacterized membrane protein